MWRAGVAVFAVECVLVVSMLHARGMFDRIGMDFLTSYTAAAMLAGGDVQQLFDTRAQWEYQRPIVNAYDVSWADRVMHPYIAPPPLAAITLPFLTLSPVLATIAWISLNLLATIVAVSLLVKQFNLDRMATYASVFASFPLFYLLILGQVEGLLVLAFSVFLIQLHKGNDVRAGFALALFALKPPLLLAPLAFLLVAGRRKALWTTVSAVGAQAIVSIAVVGAEGVHDFITLSRRLSGAEGSTVTNVHGMVNVRSVIVRAFPSDSSLLVNISIVTLTLAMLGAAILAWRRAGEAANSPAGFALLSVTMLLTSYHALYHTSIFAVLALVLLVNAANGSDGVLRPDAQLLAGWIFFVFGPLLLFLIVPTSKLPAGLSVIGALLLWGACAYAVAQSSTADEPARVPEDLRLSPRRSSWSDERIQQRR
jgi:hypothetical protein